MRTVFLLFLFLSPQVFGQVSGRIKNAGGEPVSFANVILVSVVDSATILGTTSDADGAFRLTPAGGGMFYLRTTSVGYKAFRSPPFEIKMAGEAVTVPDLVLKEMPNVLNEVIVAGRKEWMESTPTGSAFNLQSSLFSKGSTALQVLERLPGILLDRRNNQFSLNGQSNVAILFNGRRVNLSPEEVMALLESTVADNIEKIELITSPTAQYDADGGAGAINIIFKKNENEGTLVNLSATAGYGVREKAVTSLSLSQGFKKAFFNASYSFLHDAGKAGFKGAGTGNMAFAGGESYNEFSNFTERVQNTHNLNAAAEFNLSSKFMLGFDIAYSFNKSDNLSDIGGFWDFKNAEDVRMKSLADGRNRRRNLMTAGYLKKRFSEKSQLAVDGNFILYTNDNPNLINSQYFDADWEPIVPENAIFSAGNRGMSTSSIQVGVLKADYSLQPSAKFTMDFGVKGSLAENANDSRVERMTGGQWMNDPRSQSEVYSREQLLAVYAQFKFLKNTKSNLTAGLRYEYWNRTVNLYKNPFRIAKFFPSLLYTYQLTENSSLSLNYNRRISRPAYSDLVSNLFYNDPTAVFTGNPLLKPGLTDVVRADFTRGGYVIGLSFQRDIDPIIRHQLVANEARDILILSPQNLDYQKSINLFLTAPFQWTNWWKMTLSSTTSLRNYKLSYSLTPAVKTFVSQNFTFNQTFRLPGKIDLEVSGWRNFVQFEGTNRISGFGVVNAGLAKKLPKNRGTIQLTVSDVFKSFSIYTHIGAVAPIVYDINTVSNWRDESAFARIFRVTYSRSFGQQNRRTAFDKDNVEERERVRR